MSTSSSAIFSGSSRFSADFQQAVSRAVSIASLPLTQLSKDAAMLTSKESAYSRIGSKFAAVQSAIDSLKSAVKCGYSATTSDSSIVNASAGSGASAGTYSIGISQAGAFSQYISVDSANTVIDPNRDNLAAGTSFTLTVDGVATPIQASAPNLANLVLAINQASAGVQAGIVNLGTPASPNYVLTVQGTAWRKEDIQITDSNGTPLLRNLSDGQAAVYTVNGQPPGGISTDSSSVTIAPGVNASLQPKTGTAVITSTRNTLGLSNALSALATAYNAALAEINTHHGQNAGVLQGDSQLNSLAADLRNMINFGNGQAINTLGLTFDKNGILSVDASRLSSQPEAAVSAFLGDGTSDGFLKNAAGVLASVQNDLLPGVQNTLQAAVKRKDDDIAAMQSRIDRLQANLNERMAAADALVASLEQNVSYFTAMFVQENTNAGLYK